MSKDEEDKDKKVDDKKDDNNNGKKDEDKDLDLPLGETFFSEEDKIAGKKGSLPYKRVQELIDEDVEKQKKKEDGDKDADAQKSEDKKDDQKSKDDKKSNLSAEDQAKAQTQAEAVKELQRKVSNVLSMYSVTHGVDLDEEELGKRIAKLAKDGEKITLKTPDKVAKEMYAEVKEKKKKEEEAYAKEKEGGPNPLSRDKSIIDDGKRDKVPVKITENEVQQDFANYRNDRK